MFLFFSISGFLISYSLLNKLQNKNYSFRHYFVDRFSRIYSGLLVALLFIAVVAAAIYYTNSTYYNYLAGLHSPPSLQSLLATLTMTMSYPSGALNATSSILNLPSVVPSVSAFGLDSVLWSLGVEWWLYMFFGWLVIGALGFFGFRPRCRGYKPLFVMVTAALSLVLLGLTWDYSAFIVVWFLGVLAMLVISVPSVSQKLAGGWVTRFSRFFGGCCCPDGVSVQSNLPLNPRILQSIPRLIYFHLRLPLIVSDKRQKPIWCVTFLTQQTRCLNQRWSRRLLLHTFSYPLSHAFATKLLKL